VIDIQELYEDSVQDSEGEVYFLSTTYKSLRKKKAITLREDFCGTFFNSMEWVRSASERKSIAVDRDPRVLRSGKKRHLSVLTPEQLKRISLQCHDVTTVKTDRADILATLNFSICYFHSRQALLAYLRNVYKSLTKTGVAFVDLLGGTEVENELDERRPVMSKKYGKFYYIWEQKGFDPVTRKIHFAIHFELKNKRRIKNAFTYDWRLWTVPEIVEAMEEVGFKEVKIYWEGNDAKGDGSGIFKQVKKAENCEVWVAYAVGLK